MITSGPMMGSYCPVSYVVHGRGGHSSVPEKACDPLIPAMEIHKAHRELISSYKSQGLNVTSWLPNFHSGTVANVIPDTTHVEGSFRSLSLGVLETFSAEFTARATEIAAEHKCHVDVSIRENYPILINTPAETEILRKIAQKVLGDDNVVSEGVPVYAGEDFAYYTQKVPGAFIFLASGRIGTSEDPMLHRSNYNFNDDLIPIASQLWFELVVDRLGLVIQ
eukprot:TRINITY_DN3965_c0_g1_i2.p1 TRINITY_DN3965_c0_g1~~TRINITY_DN3965_c0_g1_i2.p1  ORF type:complete len:222 (+),score=19.31 TRINITY_DN3965_c0_g1_i2:641-1306(+)